MYIPFEVLIAQFPLSLMWAFLAAVNLTNSASTLVFLVTCLVSWLGVVSLLVTLDLLALLLLFGVVSFFTH